MPCKQLDLQVPWMTMCKMTVLSPAGDVKLVLSISTLILYTMTLK